MTKGVIAKLHNFHGERLTVKEIAQRTGISKNALWDRIRTGQSAEQAAVPKPSRARLYTMGNLTLRAGEWSKITGIPAGRIIERIARLGWPVEQALTTALMPTGTARPGTSKRYQYNKLPVIHDPTKVTDEKYPPNGNTIPARPKRTSKPAVTITFNGETLTRAEWAKRIGITPDALAERLKSDHWTFEEAMTLPSNGKPSKPYTKRHPKVLPKRTHMPVVRHLNGRCVIEYVPVQEDANV
jgi:hypothetical protein